MTPAAGFDPKAYLQQGSWGDVRLGLARTRELLAGLGNPQDRLKFVHVAGTNGKGSTSAFTASICQAAGLRTGLFTSPYVMEFNERIQVDRKSISDADLLDVTRRAKAQADRMEDVPSSFELLTAVALTYFAEQACDIVVLEVGLGGRLDSTNVIEHPLVCAITPIALDHTAILGDTVAAIAAEKAGIIKPGSPVVCCTQEPEAARVIRSRCAELGCSLTVPRFSRAHARYEDGFQVLSYDGIDNVRLSMCASYQPVNAVMAIEIARLLRVRGLDISDAHIKAGLEAARWPGRFDIVGRNPAVVVDGGHNEQGARVLADSLRCAFGGAPVTFVMSVLADKDYRAMIEQVAPLAARVFTVSAPYTDRALPAQDLAAAVRDAGIEQVRACRDFTDACENALCAAGRDGVVCCFGSLYSVGEAMRALESAGALTRGA